MVVHVDPDHTLRYFEHRADICPLDDVEWWGVEGVDQVIDEGGPRDWMKLAEAIALDPLGLIQGCDIRAGPGQYLAQCPGASAERAEVADVLKRILQSAIDEEDDPLRHVPPWFKPKSTRPWVVRLDSGNP